MFKKIVRFIIVISLLQIIVGGLELAGIGGINSQTKYIGIPWAIFGGVTLIACSVISMNMRLKRLNIFMLFIFINFMFMIITCWANIYFIGITVLLALALVVYFIRYNIIKMKI